LTPIATGGNANYQLGKSDLAIRDYNEGLKLNPKDGDLFITGVSLIYPKEETQRQKRISKKPPC